MVSIEEYREIMRDEVSSEELILKRLQYLESFCRNIIRLELSKYKKPLYNFSLGLSF